MLYLLSGLLAVALVSSPLLLWSQSRNHKTQTTNLTNSYERQIALLTNLLTQEKQTTTQQMNLLLSKDPMTLANLQAITSSGASDSSEYVPTGDAAEALRYEQMAYGEDGLPPGFTDVTELNDDLSDAGFSPIES